MEASATSLVWDHLSDIESMRDQELIELLNEYHVLRVEQMARRQSQNPRARDPSSRMRRLVAAKEELRSARAAHRRALEEAKSDVVRGEVHAIPYESMRELEDTLYRTARQLQAARDECGRAMRSFEADLVREGARVEALAEGVRAQALLAVVQALLRVGENVGAELRRLLAVEREGAPARMGLRAVEASAVARVSAGQRAVDRVAACVGERMGFDPVLNAVHGAIARAVAGLPFDEELAGLRASRRPLVAETHCSEVAERIAELARRVGGCRGRLRMFRDAG